VPGGKADIVYFLFFCKDVVRVHFPDMISILEYGISSLFPCVSYRFLKP
jgi:hypothetical protein